jgi:hypothetical protein
VLVGADVGAEVGSCAAEHTSSSSNPCCLTMGASKEGASRSEH